LKTFVFDAGALFAFLQSKPGAPKVGELLKRALRGDAKVLISAVNLGEVYGRILRDYGPDDALASMQAVKPLPLEAVDATTNRASHAAEVKAKYKLYFADSFAAALAIEYKASLVTSDSDFRKLGHSFPMVWLKV
jgi:predicted nucleic acid-binding protein